MPAKYAKGRAGRVRMRRTWWLTVGSVVGSTLLVFALAGCRAAGVPASTGPTGEELTVPAGEPVEGIVGPDGGTLASATGAIVIEVPAGALDEDTPIAVTPIDEAVHPWAVPGTVYRFEPAGLAFNQPVTLTMRYDPAYVTASEPEAGIRLHRIDGEEWIELDSVVDPHQGTVSAQVNGFSRYGVRAVAPVLSLDVGVIHALTLIPLASTSVRTNSCIAGACDDIETMSDDYPTELIPVFLTSTDGCSFRTGQFAGFLEDYMPVETSGDGGSAYVTMSAHESGSRAWFEYELNSFAQPVHAPGHNTTSTVVSHLSFMRLDHLAPGERRLVVDIRNPGGVTFDLAIAWLVEGGAAGVFTPHVQAGSEVFLLGCGQSWEQARRIDLFSAIASPITGSEIEEAGVQRVHDLSNERLQLWVGLHIMTRARSAYGDDEGTVGYGLIDGGQAGVTGSFAVVAEPPQ